MENEDDSQSYPKSILKKKCRSEERNSAVNCHVWRRQSAFDEIRPILKKNKSEDGEVKTLTSILKKRDSTDGNSEIQSILKRHSLTPEGEHILSSCASSSNSDFQRNVKISSNDERLVCREECLPKSILKKRSSLDESGEKVKSILKKNNL